MIILYIFLAMLIWYIIGCAVLAYIDEDDALFNWVKSAPPPKDLYAFVVIMFFPITAYLYMKGK